MAQGAGCRARGTGHGAQGTEHRAQGGGLRAQGAEFIMVSATLHKNSMRASYFLTRAIWGTALKNADSFLYWQTRGQGEIGTCTLSPNLLVSLSDTLMVRFSL